MFWAARWLFGLEGVEHFQREARREGKVPAMNPPTITAIADEQQAPPGYERRKVSTASTRRWPSVLSGRPSF